MKATLTSLLLLGGLTVTAHAQDDRQSLSLTVYNNDLGVVRDVRKFDLKQGKSTVQMQDVPSRIDPTTVKITDAAHPNDIEVVEQNYQYDLVSQQKLLEKYIDKKITVVDDKGIQTEGTLLAIEDDKLTLATPTGIVMLPNLMRYTMRVPELAQGLITKPTLIWQVQSTRNFTREPLEVMYQTAGIAWHTEYIATLDDGDKNLDLTGWVSINNHSGMTYPEAKLKLIAGALNRVQQQRPPIYMRSEMSAKAAAPQFEEHGMFEYHVYDLGRQTTIANNEEKQISLLSAEGVSAEKRYTYEGGSTVAVTVAFQNAEANHLGMPLPMGTVRVMKRDKDGSLEFVGEDHIEHTPRDEKLTLHVGNAFDLTGERTVTNEQSLGTNSNEETVEIKLRNHKDDAVTIDAVENVGANWEITNSSMTYEKKNANTIVFHVPVKARGAQTVTYTVRHRW